MAGVHCESFCTAASNAGLSILGFGVRAEALDGQQPLPCGSLGTIRSRFRALRIALSLHESLPFLSNILFKNMIIIFNSFHRKF